MKCSTCMHTHKKKCKCKKEWIKEEIEVNAFPYGDNIKRFICTNCKKIIKIECL